MTDKRWSLANRLTWWIAWIVVLPQLAAFGVGGLFLDASVAREVVALVSEEVEEARAALLRAEDPVVMFGPLSAALAAQHPGIHMGWRLLDDRTGAVLGEYGERRLFADLELSMLPADRAIDVGRGLLARTDTTPGGVRLLLVVDGKSHHAFLRRYWLAAGVMIALSTAVALLGSRLLANRVAGLVRGVADDVHAARGQPGDLRPRPASPDEIRAVVDGLRDEMRQIRAESDKVRVFTAGLAHELRSPLQNLIGQAEVTLLRPRDVANYAAVLASQLEELAELSDAVDNLLAYCTASADARTGVEEFDLAQEADLRLQRERGRAEREGVDLQIRTHGDTRCAGDREAMLRGVRNLVANAIDWTPRGGCVSVAIAGGEGRITVTVDDSGPGVPLEERERIFAPFVRGGVRDRKRIGYGLGLAIAQTAVRDHGGRIDVDTSPLGGARFTMTLPVGRESAAAPVS